MNFQRDEGTCAPYAGNVSEHQPRKSSKLNFKIGDETYQSTAKANEAQTYQVPERAELGSVNDDEVYKREYSVERIVGRTERKGISQYIIRLSGYASKDDMVEPLERLPDHLMSGCSRHIGKRMEIAVAPAWK